YFQPSVSFAQKGFKIEIMNNFKRNVDALLAEVDLGLLLKFGDERLGRGVFLSIAPYFTYGFGGKTKETVLNPIEEDYNVEKEIQTFEYCNRSDLGFKLGIGYDFSKHWEVAVNYTFGMNKIVNTDNYKWKAWNLQLVYFF
ncbi:MAG TPA: PorT family protein, partial [Candidatus Onthomorpha intestinigallinarum]|nr:PorT family protein [Candidatus Onthomorpha intestinigallinarum]